MTLSLVSALGTLSASTPTFHAPFQVKDGDLPITVDACHAAPLYVDYDEDGRKELLVGQFGGGKLRIYRNKGTDDAPVFEGFTWFEAGGEIASIPSG